MNTDPQPDPTPNKKRPIWELVIEDMQARDRLGRLKYGTRLQADNGRNPLVDAYQESLDQSAYLRQEIEERDSEVRFKITDNLKAEVAKILEATDLGTAAQAFGRAFTLLRIHVEAAKQNKAIILLNGPADWLAISHTEITLPFIVKKG